MNFTAKDIVGMCAYEFYHDNDNTIVQDAHKDCEFLSFVSLVPTNFKIDEICV